MNSCTHLYLDYRKYNQEFIYNSHLTAVYKDTSFNLSFGLIQFSLYLHQVLFLMGKARSGDGREGKKRRSLRDTSLRFQGRDELYKGISSKGEERSKSICASSFSGLSNQVNQDSPDNLLLIGTGMAPAQHRKGSWCSGMN